MRAIWLEKGELELRRDLPTPVVAAGEALVRVVCAGICNTDLELMRGYYPFRGVLGHEFVGRVEQGPQELLGQRVVGEINAVCGVCEMCDRGHRSHCERRTVLGIVGRDGAFADYLTLPAENLHRVPDSLPSSRAVFVEPLAAALQIQQQVPMGPEDRVLVVGDGKLGQLIASSLALTACDLLLVGRHARKLDLLLAQGIRATDEPPAAATFDVAIDCSGNRAGFAVARRALRPRGVLVMKSTYAGDLTVDASSLVVDELTVVGSRCGPFEPALRLLAAGDVDPTPLIAGSYPLLEGLAAFDHAARPGTLKILLEISDD